VAKGNISLAQLKPTQKISSQVCINCQALIPESQNTCLSCGFIFQDGTKPSTAGLSQLPVGKRIGEYLILELLNLEPASINLYMCEASQGQTILLKETLAESAPANNLRQIHEILQTVKKPGLPLSSELVEHDSRLYQALEWKSGRDLQSASESTDSLGQKSLEWIKQLCSLVNELNLAGAVCVELEPANLGLDAEGNLFIRDFTLLRRIPLENETPIGYSLYVAPEVYTNPQDVSPRTDVYAIGTAWLALILGRALKQTDFQERYLLPPARLLNQSQLPPEITRLLSRALLPALNKRYKSPLLLKTAIEHFQAQQATSQALRERYEKLSFLAAWTDQGMERENNEDNFFAQSYSGPLGPFTVALVADGMGGEEGGEVASLLVIETIKTVLPKKISEICAKLAISEESQNLATVAGYLKPLLVEVINKASEKVFNEASEQSRLKNMGSTAVIMVVIQNYLFIANVGDSRAYLARPTLKSGLVQLNEDHTRLAELRRKGRNVSEGEESQLQGVLSRNLGNTAVVEPFFSSFLLQSGDFILLCCDGLTDSLTDEQLYEQINTTSKNSLLQICFNLIIEANLAGGHDNITVALYQHP